MTWRSTPENKCIACEQDAGDDYVLIKFRYQYDQVSDAKVCASCAKDIDALNQGDNDDDST